MSDIYLKKESDYEMKWKSDYSEENTSDSEDFCSTIFQPFQFEPEHNKNRVVMRAMRKKLNIFTLQLPIYYILEKESQSVQMRSCKNEGREIDCLCCREVDAMLIASAKIPEREGSISSSSFYRQRPHVLALST